jgi:hypothetical protein
MTPRTIRIDAKPASPGRPVVAGQPSSPSVLSATSDSTSARSVTGVAATGEKFVIREPVRPNSSGRRNVETAGMGKERTNLIKAGRRAVSRGVTPRYQVDVERRRITQFPWLEFDGLGQAAIAEAARRSIAAELRVRPDQVEVETAEDLNSPTPPRARRNRDERRR